MRLYVLEFSGEIKIIKISTVSYSYILYIIQFLSKYIYIYVAQMHQHVLREI